MTATLQYIPDQWVPQYSNKLKQHYREVRARLEGQPKKPRSIPITCSVDIQEIPIHRPTMSDVCHRGDHHLCQNVTLYGWPSCQCQCHRLVEEKPDTATVPVVVMHTLPSIMACQDICILHFKISYANLLTEQRTARYVWPRQVAMWLCCTQTPNSLHVIGKHFGGKDHTTVMHARNKVEERRLKDPEFAKELGELAAQCLR